jgi:hypothetical protein
MTAAQSAQQKRAAFLAALAETANVSRACLVARLPRRTAYDARAADPAFAAAWDAAVELGTDALEDEAVRRAHEGTVKPVFYKGAECGGIREYSDTLLIFMLKARRPERYRERSALDLNATIHRDPASYSDAELAAIVAAGRRTDAAPEDHSD